MDNTNQQVLHFERGAKQGNLYIMKILVSDDSMTVRKKLVDTIKSLINCEIFEAKDGEMAISMYKEHTPDLVFMDIMMPIKDGLEAVAEIVTSDQSAKIVMLSSVGTKANLQKALKFGAVDFIQKPCEKERLQIILNTYLKEE